MSLEFFTKEPKEIYETKFASLKFLGSQPALRLMRPRGYNDKEVFDQLAEFIEKNIENVVIIVDTKGFSVGNIYDVYTERELFTTQGTYETDYLTMDDLQKIQSEWASLVEQREQKPSEGIVDVLERDILNPYNPDVRF